MFFTFSLLHTSEKPTKPNVSKPANYARHVGSRLLFQLIRLPAAEVLATALAPTGYDAAG